jgi:hypothetical protein
VRSAENIDTTPQDDDATVLIKVPRELLKELNDHVTSILNEDKLPSIMEWYRSKDGIKFLSEVQSQTKYRNFTNKRLSELAKQRYLESLGITEIRTGRPNISNERNRLILQLIRDFLSPPHRASVTKLKR